MPGTFNTKLLLLPFALGTNSQDLKMKVLERGEGGEEVKKKKGGVRCILQKEEDFLRKKFLQHRENEKGRNSIFKKGRGGREGVLSTTRLLYKSTYKYSRTPKCGRSGLGGGSLL